MLDHLGIYVSHIEKARLFYQKALAPLNITPVMEVTNEETGGHGHHIGFGGEDKKPSFWVADGVQSFGKTHVAFVAKNRAAVDAFYQAAMSAGGKDNGEPGLRPHYHPDYYGAFVYDLDGHNIEAVCHLPE